MASRRATDKIGVNLISSMCVILSFSEESEIRFASAWSGVETPGWRLVTSVLGIVYCVGSNPMFLLGCQPAWYDNKIWLL